MLVGVAVLRLRKVGTMSNWYVDAVEGEVPYRVLQEKKDNGEFHEWNFEPFEFQENGYEDVLDEIKKYRAVDYLALEAEYKRLTDEGKTEEASEYKAKMDKMVQDVYDIYRKKNILPIQYFSELGVMEEIQKCINYKAFFDGDTVSCGAGVGTVLCNYLFPNIFDTPSAHDLDKEGARSLWEKFHNEEYLKRAIKFCFSYKDGCPVPTNVTGGLRMVGSAPTNFRPMNAKAVYERFCPKGGVIFDPCCVSGDTEFFNGREWKRIDEYVEGERVLQYNEDGTASVVKPIEYINYEDGKPFYSHDSEELSSTLTGNHDVVYQEKGTLGLKKVKFETLLQDLDNYDKYIVPISCEMIDKGMEVHAMGKRDMSYAVLCYKDNVRYDNGLLDYEGDDVVFSDKVFTLPLANRRFLLRRLGFFSQGIIVDGRTHKNSERLVTLYNLSISKTENPAVLGKDGTIYIKDSADVHYDWSNIKVIFDNHKYCFVVPSHMLVLRKNGKIFITGNCGFGGRMLGALSSKNNYKSVGTDPCTETMYHLHELGEYIEMVTGREDSYDLHCVGSEDFLGKPDSIDFAFSSPPYFNLEIYSDEDTQCYNKFPTLEEWLEGYVRKTIQNIKYMLKPGRVYAINIADFKVGGGKTCAYVDEWIRISTEEGMPLFDTVYLGVTPRAGSKEQSAGELKKENILVFKKPF